MSDKKSLSNLIYRWRVRSGLLFVIPVIFLAQPNLNSLLAGMGFTVLGLLLRGWACGHLSKEKHLTTSGPYRYTRNPLYLGSFIMGLGLVAASRSWWVGGLFLIYFLLFFPIAIIREKEKMFELFPQEYADYSQHVPLFFPTWKPFSRAEAKAFQWSQYKINREYRAFVAGIIFWALLILKTLLF